MRFNGQIKYKPMKVFKLFFPLFIILHFSLEAQEYSREFGVIGKEEFELEEYAADKSAEAVVFFDIGQSKFIRSDNSFDIVFERTTRIKILSEAGIDWAEVEIPYYQEGEIYEKIYDLEAYTINYVDGLIQRSKLNTENCYTEKLNKYWNLKKFAMPNVKVGSIIEYRYKILSQYRFNLRDWDFQRRIPTVYSKYEVRMVPFYEYTFLLQGKGSFDYQNSYKDKKGLSHQFGPVKYNMMVHEYAMIDIPAFKDEEYISSINDFIIKIDFQLSRILHLNGSTTDILTSWPELIQDLSRHENFGRYVKKASKQASKLLDLNGLANESPRERFDKIISYVKGNYTWNKKNGKYASKSVSQFINDGYGNAADINLFTVGLLNAAGIEAYPLISSTRGNGTIKYDYPYSQFFNYVLIAALIDGEQIVSDATEILSAGNRIPTRCINDKGLLIDKAGLNWLPLSCNFNSSLSTTMLIEPSEDEVSARIIVKGTEYNALALRRQYGDDRKRIVEKLEDKGYSVNDTSIVVKNQLNIEKPYSIEYTVTNSSEYINDKIYLSPFLYETLEENPLKQNSRRYPIDMVYPSLKIYYAGIKIPDGYKIDFLPENYQFSNDKFELKYLTQQSDSMLSISFSYHFKKAVYSASDYLKIKFYFNDIVRKGNEKIVFSRDDEPSEE